MNNLVHVESMMKSETNSQDWQQSFIATNLLVLGYNAWVGFLNGERGAVICSLNNPLIGVTGETFHSHFVPRCRLAPFLNAWLLAPDTAILQNHHINGHILQAVDTYNPVKDVIMLLESGQQVTFFYLRNLPISPAQCYDRICKEWAEFQPQSTHLNEKNLPCN